MGTGVDVAGLVGAGVNVCVVVAVAGGVGDGAVEESESTCRVGVTVARLHAVRNMNPTSEMKNRCLFVMTEL